MTSRLLEEQALSSRLEKVAILGRLATNVAQEVSNPLAAINGYAHLLRGHVANIPDAQGILGGIERESTRIDLILRGMLDYARPRHPVREQVDVNRAAQSALELLKEQGALRAVRVKMSLESGVPPLVGDHDDVERVFVNLITNAVDALDGKGDVSIVTQRAPFSLVSAEGVRRASDSTSIRMSRDPNPRLKAWLTTVGEPKEVLKIVVADSGPGVALSDSERVFDPFYSTKGAGKAVGMGLAIVSRIVESMGGAIWVRTAREGGAAFMVIFPVATFPES